MYPTSEAYKTAIAQNVRDVKITGTITLKDGITVINISDADIVQGSLYFTEQCVSGEDIEIGNVYASELGLSLNSPPENPYALDGARIVLNFGIETSEDVWEYVPLGYFYVTEIERKTNAVALKALDGMILFDTDLSVVLTTGTPYEMISSCCTKVGITLATDSATFATFVNGNMTFTLPAESNVKTCRDLIMWICQLTGTFARMNRMGQLEIVPVKLGASVKTIDKQQRFTSDVSDSYVKITKVAMKVGDVEYSQGTDGMTMVLEENPLLVGKSETEINTVLSNILNQITTAEYIPYNVNFAGDPALQAGDYINLTGIKVFDKIRATFTRSTPAYLSDGTQVAANVPRFEQGKFGKAIMVEEGTTNVVADPSFENADITANWNAASVANWAYTGIARVRDTTRKKYGSASVKCGDGATPGKGIAEKNQGTAAHAVSAGQIWTLSFDVYATNSGTQYIALIRCYDSSGNNISNSVTPPSDWRYTSYYQALYFSQKVPGANAWYRITKQFTVPSGVAYVAISLQYYVGGDYYVWFDGVQFENKPYATSFINGTRAAETLTIPTAGVLNPQEGTMEFYHLFRSDSEPIPWLVSSSLPNYTQLLAVVKSNANTIRFRTRNLSGTSTVEASVTDGWHYVAARWNSTEIALFIDGVKVGTAANPYLPTQIADIIAIGYNHNNSSQYCNSLIDDLRISNRARTDEEIVAAYASGQPLPVDEWTTLKISFDDTLSGISTAGDSIITHSTWRYRGPHNIKAVGKSALVRGVQAQQNKSVSAVKTVAEAAREIAQAANQSTQLINDAIGGHVLIRQAPDETNEILIMDSADPAQAVKIWRWNMGGLGYSDNCTGADNPQRQYEVAMTMDGTINANFIKTGTITGVTFYSPYSGSDDKKTWSGGMTLVNDSLSMSQINTYYTGDYPQWVLDTQYKVDGVYYKHENSGIGYGYYGFDRDGIRWVNEPGGMSDDFYDIGIKRILETGKNYKSIVVYANYDGNVVLQATDGTVKVLGNLAINKDWEQGSLDVGGTTYIDGNIIARGAEFKRAGNVPLEIRSLDGGMSFIDFSRDSTIDYNARFVLQSGGFTYMQNGGYNFYINSNLWVASNVSAASFTDRTPAYKGDALSEIAKITDDGEGKINHNTLPPFARKTITSQKIIGTEKIQLGDGTTKEIEKVEIVEEEGRDIGAMVSILTVGIQQLVKRVEKLEEVVMYKNDKQ